jgi:hypothetical protein
MKPNSKILFWCAALSVSTSMIYLACSSSGGGGGGGNGSGICRPTCDKDCNIDNDCNVSAGELCCNISSVGKACLPASACPRACTMDNTCNVQQGEACLRRTLQIPDRFCSSPQQGIKGCTTDNDCAGTTSSKCCGIYSQAICLPPNRCPTVCNTGSDCNSSFGEICCKTLNKLDSSVTASGLCITPSASLACPTACTQSSDCQTQNGELCCPNGLCALTCEKTCQSSNDCSGQLCCKNALTNANISTPMGYPVVTTTGVGGAGGTGGRGGTGGSGGTGGIGGATGCTGNTTTTRCTCTCAFSGDGVCDDGGNDPLVDGTATTSCAYGTDCADCGPRPISPPNNNSCQFAGMASLFPPCTCLDGVQGNASCYGCAYGTDLADCGAR